MKKSRLFLSLAFFSICLTLNAQQENLLIEGAIGKYAIEMTVTASDRDQGTFIGTYNYKGRKNKLSLEGEVFGSCLLIKEFYNGKNTGEFYLELEENEIKGKWLDSNRWYTVELQIISGDRSHIEKKSIEELSKDVSDVVSGTYEAVHYFINDMWFEDNRPNIELGFNGGKFAVEEHKGDSLTFAFEVICGPTYHFAMGSGTAYKSGDVYICQLYEECQIEIAISEKKIKAIAHGSSVDCGFGARAYLDDIFVKTSEDFGLINQEH